MEPGVEQDSDRQRIIDASWDVLERTSYENLKVQAVLRFARVSTRAFYRHFDSKQELVSELLRLELVRATAILDQLTSSAHQTNAFSPGSGPW